jgi:hypothetical protein
MTSAELNRHDSLAQSSTARPWFWHEMITLVTDTALDLELAAARHVEVDLAISAAMSARRRHEAGVRPPGR